MTTQFDVFAVRGDEEATINVVEAGAASAMWDAALAEACARYLK